MRPYWQRDVPRLRHASVGKTNYVYDQYNPEHNGAFLNLLQHHGYPTPLLDWTFSPYIAAYFAFSSAQPNDENDGSVRIFMFDYESWKEDFNSVLHMNFCRPHFSVFEPFALGNDRALPQQCVSAVTNIDDVEEYIRLREREQSKQYLRVFDLPKSERSKVLYELGLMGISPGSLFPGIEGFCKEYRDRDFGY